MIINLLLIEREPGGTGEYWPEVMAAETRRNEFVHRGPIFSKRLQYPSVISLNLWRTGENRTFYSNVYPLHLSRLSCPRVFEFIVTFREANVCDALIVYPLSYVSSMSTAWHQWPANADVFPAVTGSAETSDSRKYLCVRRQSRLLSVAHDP